MRLRWRKRISLKLPGLQVEHSRRLGSGGRYRVGLPVAMGSLEFVVLYPFGKWSSFTISVFLRTRRWWPLTFAAKNDRTIENSIDRRR